MARIERRPVSRATTHHGLARATAIAVRLFLDLPVMHAAKGAGIGQRVELRGKVHIGTRHDMVADEANG